MKVLLTVPPRAKSQILQILPPMGLGYIARKLVEAGHDVEVLDLLKDPMDTAEYLDYLATKNPDIVGFSIFTPDVLAVKQLAQEIPFYDERHRVKPGLTGWAQLCYQYGSSSDDARNKLEFDLYYVKNASFFLDLIVLLETVEVVLWGKGAH